MYRVSPQQQPLLPEEIAVKQRDLDVFLRRRFRFIHHQNKIKFASFIDDYYKNNKNNLIHNFLTSNQHSNTFIQVNNALNELERLKKFIIISQEELSQASSSLKELVDNTQIKNDNVDGSLNKARVRSINLNTFMQEINEEIKIFKIIQSYTADDPQYLAVKNQLQKISLYHKNIIEIQSKLKLLFLQLEKNYKDYNAGRFTQPDNPLSDIYETYKMIDASMDSFEKELQSYRKYYHSVPSHNAENDFPFTSFLRRLETSYKQTFQYFKRSYHQYDHSLSEARKLNLMTLKSSM